MFQERLIERRTPESRAVTEEVGRSIAAAERLNRLQYADADGVRVAWTELTGQQVDPAFSLIPPLHCQHASRIRVGERVFINQGCTFIGIGGIEIGDDVLVGPNVSLITAGHPLDPAARRSGITAAPITIGSNVWLGAGAIILQGVEVGEDSVVAAGAVVTHDVPPATLVGGVPARVLRGLGEQ